MTLVSFNEKMRQKPKPIRAQWAFWGAFLITGALGMVWLLYIPGKLDRLAHEALETREEPSGNFRRVLESMKASVSEALGGLKKDLASSTAAFATSTLPQPAASTTATSSASDSNTFDIEALLMGTAVIDIPDAERGEPTGGSFTETETPHASSVPVSSEPRRVLIGTSSRASSTPSGE